MKKFLSLVAVSSFLCSSFAIADDIGSASGEKSGVFVGASSGVALGISGMGLKTIIELGPNFGLKAGYQQFFIPLFGMRSYLDYDFYYGGEGFTNFEGIGASRHNITLNLDLLLNFVNNNNFTFGVYIGFGLGYSIYNLHNLYGNKAISSNFYDIFKQLEKNSNNLNSFNIPMNIGVTATFTEHHKVELGIKMPTLDNTPYTSYIYQYITNHVHISTPFLISIGYSYIF